MAAIVGIVASLVGPAIELGKCIIAPIKREFSYLCCFNSHIKKLKDEAKKLEDASAGLQMQVDAAERNAEQIIPEVKTWLTSANNEIQVNMSGIENEVPNVQIGCSTIISRYSLSRKAKKTTDSMKELRDGCSKFDRISSPAPPAAMVSIPLGQTYEFESRKQIEKDIMEALRSKNVNIMGICGMGGVGKTTMAKRIMTRVMEERLFDEVVMTVVGQQVDMLKIQSDISESLDLELGKETLSARAHRLRIRLRGTKKSLIVVDDIWEILKFEDLGIPIESGVEGHCTVLLTSRDRGVLSAMEAKKVYAIETLSKSEALFLFKEKSGICSDDFNLLSIGEDIANECRGLPIALTTVGSALKDKKFKPIWEDALQQLKDSNPIDIPGVLRDVYNPLKLSYDFLDSQHARSLFLLCCLFPEDYNISLRYLTLFCMGLRIFEGISNLEQVRNRVFMIVEMLKSRFLLLDASSGHHLVKMHDVVRDVAILIASKEGFIDVNLHSRGHNSSECKWISFFPENRSQLQPDTMQLNFPSLRMLMMHCLTWERLEIEDFSFLEEMKELSVLSFKSISFKSVPQSMQLLKNLRTLHFEYCSLETFFVVGELSSLEILCFRHCGLIKKVPTEIGRLNHLKLLEFSDCAELKTIPPGVLSNLIELEELTMVKSFNKWESAGAKEKESRNVNVSLHELQLLLQLTCLNIEIKDCTLAAEDMHFSSNIVKYHIKLGTSPFLRNQRPLEKKMHLNLPRGITIGNWIHTFAESTEELCLSGDGSNILDLLQAPNVKSLHLRNCSTVKKLMDTTSVDRWRFDILYLSNLPKLEEICDVPNARESNSFKNLKELNLVNLPALEHLWNNPNQNIPLSNLSSIKVQKCGLCSLAIAMDSLSQLQDLRIGSCSMMKQVFSSKRDGKKSHITFPQLKRLELFHLESLTTFCQEIGSIEFPMLTRIEIQNCPGITSLVSSIENDQNSGSTHLFCSQQVSFVIFPALECLKLSGLHNLEEMYDGPILAGSNFFKNLKEIEIEELPKLPHLWRSSYQNEEKEKYGEITTHITFQQLGRLVLRNLKNLITFSKGNEIIEFAALTDMRIVDCPKLINFDSSSIENHQNSPNRQDDHSNHLFYKVTFGRLTKLTIGGYNNISKIWCHQIPDSFFSGLEELEIVEFDSIRSLFSSAITRNLVKLKYLEIKDCKEMVKVIEDEEEVTEETNRSLLSLFPRLESLRLVSLPMLESFCEWKYDLELPMLEDLYIHECSMLKVFSMGSLISAHKLEHIECPKLTSIESPMGPDGNNDDPSHLFCSLKVTFGRLRELTIKGYNNISKIWCHQIPDSFFIGLEQLEIVECDSIGSLFSSALAKNLVKLKYLEIKDCKEMLKVIEDEEEVTEETNCSLLSLFPRLESLRLVSLPKLESFCEWKYDLELPMLEDLYIHECPMLKVFSMGSLISAHKLEHNKYPKLTSIESPMGPNGNNDDTSHLFCSQKVTFGKLKTLAIRYNNTGKIWCHQIQDSFFTGLKKLEITEYANVRSLFSSGIARNLVNLRYLTIKRCKEMVKVIDDDDEINRETSCPLLLFRSLQSLTLDSLPKLGSFCKWRCVVELPMLDYVHIYKCPTMKVFTLGSLVSTPKLVVIEIENQYKDVGDLNEVMKLHSCAEEGDMARVEIVE